MHHTQALKALQLPTTTVCNSKCVLTLSKMFRSRPVFCYFKDVAEDIVLYLHLQMFTSSPG